MGKIKGNNHLTKTYTCIPVVAIGQSTQCPAIHTKAVVEMKQKTFGDDGFTAGELQWKCLHVGQCPLALWPARVQSEKELLRRGGETIQSHHAIVQETSFGPSASAGQFGRHQFRDGSTGIVQALQYLHYQHGQ
ncbi:hypothetical protein GHT06_018147 [Daphnia sinensis]|uniref:Uncharacterized protein n=1 Tax=Daphnia sinensis TaxID=1820382 RepID=A0AAD5PQL9_9CRUS|nr:hypothetical protein GHT06_018147 [Daphnia sinensis]